MNARSLPLGWLAALSLLLTLPRLARADNDRAAAVWRRLHDTWEEVQPNKGKRRPFVQEQIDWQLRPNIAIMTFDSGQVETQSFVPKLNVHVEPMWLDLFWRDNDRDVVSIGIIKFDRERLIWMQGPSIPRSVWQRTQGVLQERPRDFDWTSRTRVKVVLERWTPQ